VTTGARTAHGPDPLQKALTHSLAFWAILAPILVLCVAALHGQFALDFRHAFLPAARDVLHGMSPYSAIGSPRVVAGTAFLYPPLSAYLLIPFTFLPTIVAEILAVALVSAAVPATLWILGVRDWRCYAISFLWWPVIIGMGTANLTLPLVLGLAIVWRYRDRTIVAGLVTGLVVALKLVYWPLLFWLLATRRFRTAGLAVGATLLFVLLPWGGIGFAGLSSYPHLLSSVSRSEGPRNYSVAALLHAALPSWTAATAIETVLGLGILVAVIALGRRDRDRDAFAIAILATLVLSPLLEMHYLAALLVVVALYHRTFSLPWVAPLLIWGAPGSGPGSTIQTVHILLAVAIAVAVTLYDRQPKFLSRLLSSGAGASPVPSSNPLTP
jgi:hypothetical protein